MGKDKLRRFEELNHLDRVIQPSFDEVFKKDYRLKGRWNEEVFDNDHPLILELGCGKGEYTVGLAKRFPEKNFIGVDIKGARMWKGATISNRENIRNSAFLRTRIELIDSFFAPGEVEEIWITFPDPQLKKRRAKKRLTAAGFLSMYQGFLVDNGIIHLKTDNRFLYEFTLKLALYNKLEILVRTDDLYHSGEADEILGIRTFYENQYLGQGLPIHYLKFRLPAHRELTDLPDDEQ